MFGDEASLVVDCCHEATLNGPREQFSSVHLTGGKKTTGRDGLHVVVRAE